LQVFPCEAYCGIVELTKKLGAISTALALLAILVACPILACPLIVDSEMAHSCCPHSGSHSAPHSQTSARDCPYLLLEKSRNPNFAFYVPALRPIRTSFAAIAQPLFMAERHSHIADSTGLFLRLRVLLIWLPADLPGIDLKKIERRIVMKKFVTSIAIAALMALTIGASFASPKADCCNGGACCGGDCCHSHHHK
jgi:hypothetical protein